MWFGVVNIVTQLVESFIWDFEIKNVFFLLFLLDVYVWIKNELWLNVSKGVWIFLCHHWKSWVFLSWRMIRGISEFFFAFDQTLTNFITFNKSKYQTLIKHR